jgi:hypothetical protein
LDWDLKKFIDFRDIQQFLNSLELKPYEEEIDAICRRLDIDCDGVISLKDFIASFTRVIQQRDLWTRSHQIRKYTSPLENKKI